MGLIKYFLWQSLWNEQKTLFYHWVKLCLMKWKTWPVGNIFFSSSTTQLHHAHHFKTLEKWTPGRLCWARAQSRRSCCQSSAGYQRLGESHSASSRTHHMAYFSHGTAECSSLRIQNNNINQKSIYSGCVQLVFVTAVSTQTDDCNLSRRGVMWAQVYPWHQQ